MDLRIRLKLEFTAPNTPQQNGLVERSFGYLYGMVRATLNGLNLENKCEKTGFWAECARHMTMMDGGIVRDDKRCPDEVFHDGSKPKFWGDLHTFGKLQ